MDIYGLVAELRSERMCMVQNLVRQSKTASSVSSRIFPGRNLGAPIWLDMDYGYKADTLFLCYKPLGWGRGLGVGS